MGSGIVPAGRHDSPDAGPHQAAEYTSATSGPRAVLDPFTSSEFGDLVDLILLIEPDLVRPAQVLPVVSHAFESRGTHDVPAERPDPPAGWTEDARGQDHGGVGGGGATGTDTL